MSRAQIVRNTLDVVIVSRDPLAYNRPRSSSVHHSPRGSHDACIVASYSLLHGGGDDRRHVHAKNPGPGTVGVVWLNGIGSTNLLGISFSALDKVGHDFGPNSHEVQDVLIRLDRTLGVLLAALDRLVGAGSETGTSHGTPHGYDVRVPLFLFGKGIAAGEYLEAVSPTDIAPTLAFLSGITLPRSDGRVLLEAVTSEVHAMHESSLQR